MEREPGFAEQVPAAEQVGAVVDVATVGRASAGADDAGLPEFRQVVGHHVLGLAEQLHELTDTAIAATEFADELPAERIAEQSEDLRWLRIVEHRTITSDLIDAMQVVVSGVRHDPPTRPIHVCVGISAAPLLGNLDANEGWSEFLSAV